MQNVRLPAVAGMFYPANSYELEDEVVNLLEQTRSDLSIENIFGLIVPHAGYLYSGKTAACAYNLLRNKKYGTVIILSPSHREYFPGVSVFNGEAYKTPIGDIPLNMKMKDALLNQNEIIFEGIQGHRNEHAVEVQLPFLQVVLDDFSILPVVIGDQRKKNIFRLAEILNSIIDENTLVVVSTDLSHYHSKSQAGEMDSIVESRIRSFDYESLQQDFELRNCEACGGGAVVTLMKLAELRNKKNVKILQRSDSGDVTGDESEVVGYLSAVIYE